MATVDAPSASALMSSAIFLLCFLGRLFLTLSSVFINREGFAQ
jgi:hypothetical protein